MPTTPPLDVKKVIEEIGLEVELLRHDCIYRSDSSRTANVMKSVEKALHTAYVQGKLTALEQAKQAISQGLAAEALQKII